ncbi:AraC family transcriptional regulator [Bacillus sp. H-16]|uniref:AraC family transcriptional regulator n=1 Tax=Alteribacter salitolerans TaxID=2912333 RepID=UPI001962BF4C|nr:AraC family transcriptional regulator [Alteribacter salitolerans]MBM7095149.1 AraC family transcriptional regulator [Alteribacter salitolerans]
MDMLKGMNDALSYIEENLGEHIDLKEVAKIALCSEYHFKRLFSLLSGITITEYIRRRRMTLAAMELKESKVKVIDVALGYGYQSPDAFTRVFQSYHGITPSEARHTEQNLKAYPRMTFQLTIKGGTEMKYRIIEKEAFKVAGVKYEVEMVNGVLTPDYEQMFSAISDERMKELEADSTREPRGVIHVTANYSESAEGKAAFDQYIGAAVTQAPSANYSVLDIPALTWAVFEVEGDWEQVEDHWQRIYSEWLPSSSCELAQGPEILASKDEKSEIWIPITEK